MSERAETEAEQDDWPYDVPPYPIWHSIRRSGLFWQAYRHDDRTNKDIYVKRCMTRRGALQRMNEWDELLDVVLDERGDDA